jgi:adenylate cyclase
MEYPRPRMDYTMMGDMVNLAARAESAAKSYGVYTMVTGETKLTAGKTKDDLAFRFLDRIVVKGRTQPAEVYELAGLKSTLSDERSDCLDVFSEAMGEYLAQDWEAARALFEKSETIEEFQLGDPGITTNPSLVMRERCRIMKANPPGENWNGVFVMQTK